MWQEVIEKLRESVKKGRELSYEDGAIGITALLHCPIKWSLAKSYDLDPESVEVDDGFVWEHQVKGVLKELFGEHFQEEKDLIVEVGGYKLHGHLDCFIEKEDEVIGIELKAPKVLLIKEPYNDGVFLVDDGRVVHNEVYLKQAKIERAVLEMLYPHKRVRMYLFYKSLCKAGAWSKKLYVVSEIKESMSMEEVQELLRRFHEDKSPRYQRECEGYCVFYKEGLCEGRPVNPEEPADETKRRFYELLRYYRALQSDLKNIEVQLKKMLKGSIVIGSREVGWVKRKTYEIDLEKLFLLERNALDYLMVKPLKKQELLQRHGAKIVKDEKEEVFWRV